MKKKILFLIIPAFIIENINLNKEQISSIDFENSTFKSCSFHKVTSFLSYFNMINGGIRCIGSI